MTGSMSGAQQRQQTNRTHDGRYAEGSRSEPDVDLGAQLAAGPRSGHHASSAQAYREHVEDLQRQLTDARIQQARHEIAQFATDRPDARYLTVASGHGDDGEPVLHATEVYDRDGPLTLSADDRGELSGWEAPGRGALEDFTVDSFADVVDLDKVRAWSSASVRSSPRPST